MNLYLFEIEKKKKIEKIPQICNYKCYKSMHARKFDFIRNDVTEIFILCNIYLSPIL